MILHVSVKSLNRRARYVEPVPYEFAAAPDTLRGLITALAETEVAAHNARLHATQPTLPTAEATQAMAAVGKIAFGLSLGEREADVRTAIPTAISGFSDGLYRVYLNGSELTDLDAPLSLRDGDTLTLIRLTMLAGAL